MNRTVHFTHLKNQFNKLLVKIGGRKSRIPTIYYSLIVYDTSSDSIS